MLAFCEIGGISKSWITDELIKFWT